MCGIMFLAHSKSTGLVSDQTVDKLLRIYMHSLPFFFAEKKVFFSTKIVHNLLFLHRRFLHRSQHDEVHSRQQYFNSDDDVLDNKLALEEDENSGTKSVIRYIVTKALRDEKKTGYFVPL